MTSCKDSNILNNREWIKSNLIYENKTNGNFNTKNKDSVTLELNYKKQMS